jgi:hypothetical protein
MKHAPRLTRIHQKATKERIENMLPTKVPALLWMRGKMAPHNAADVQRRMF